MGTQSTQGEYTRPLGTLENFFKSLAGIGTPFGREHWTITFAIGLDFPHFIDDPAPYLIRTWQVLRRRYPALGARLALSDPEDSQSTPVLAVGTFDAETWAKDTFITHLGDDENAESLFPRLRPTPTATCHWIPASKQLILRSSHWRIDGVGMAMLGHEFMSTLVDVLQLGPDAGFGAYTTHKPMDPPLGMNLEAVVERRTAKSDESEIPTSRPSTPPHEAAGADALVGEFLRGFPSIALPTREGSETTAPGATGRIATQLDRETTAKLTAACRKLGVSVTSAVHAAVIRVTASFPQHPLAKAYVAFTPVDLRKVLLASQDTKDAVTPLGLFHSGLPICIDGLVVNGSGDQHSNSKSLETVARELSAVYSRDLSQFSKHSIDGEERTLSLLDLAAPYVRRTTKLFSAPVPAGIPPVQNPDLSSLGKLEGYIQREYAFRPNDDDPASKVDVVNAWMATEILWRSVQFHTWSWRDQFTLAICFNQTFYEDQFVKDVLDKTINELLTGLGT